MPFANWITRINNTEVDDAHDVDVVILIYNLIEYSDNYSKSSGILWQYCRDETALAVNAITDFNGANGTTGPFKIKEKITGETGNNDTKDVEIIALLKYLYNFGEHLQWFLLIVKLILI